MDCIIEGFINGQKFRKIYEKKCECLIVRYDLRKIELDVLFFLNKYEDFDTARDIVKYSCLSKAHVSKAIDNLTKRNYLLASVNKGDRRCFHLSITDEARPIVKELNSIWENLLEVIYEGFSQEEKAVLRRGFIKIVENIDHELQEQ